MNGELAYARFLAEQTKCATGMRLEQLRKQGEGEKKLLVDLLWSVRGSFEGLVLEKEFVTLSGAKAYIDVYDERFRFGFEAEGFVPHAENITRSRFDFEKLRVRSMVALGIAYVPFTFDEMDKKPDVCRRTLYELYGKKEGKVKSYPSIELTLHEREVIRHAKWLARPIRVRDVQECLKLREDASRSVLRTMVRKGLIKPMYENRQRNHEFLLNEGILFR